MDHPESFTLLGDIGGTNARFALAHRGRIDEAANFRVVEFDGPLEALRRFLAAHGSDRRVLRARLAVAGPVSGGRARLTNGAWEFDADALARSLGLDLVELVNDFEALAWSLPRLGPEGARRIGGGKAVEGEPMVVLGPGTGFGVAGLVPCADGARAVATEGGHATLPAATAREEQILGTLRREFDHLSIERVLSGPGLVALYKAIGDMDGLAAPEADGPAIVEAALADRSPAARRALELFCDLLGESASNIALTWGARGGVYLAGGIVPRFPDFLARSGFRCRFESKGRMSGYLARIPTFVVTHPHPALIGLAGLGHAR